MVESKSTEAAATKEVEPKVTPDGKDEETKATSDSGDSASTKVSLFANVFRWLDPAVL